jgi:hypothetical protein
VSQHTSGPVITVRQRDGAFLCNHKHGNGRCRKKIMSSTGEVACADKHEVPLRELMNAYLTDGVWKDAETLWTSPGVAQAMVNRFATPEFLHATYGEWQRAPMSHWPFVSWLIHHAEIRNRKASAMLKDFLEKEIRKVFPILDRYLNAIPPQHKHKLMVVRERIFRAFVSWQSYTPTPENYLARWEIFTEAAATLGETDHMVLYEHNMAEAVLCLDSENHWPIYFESEKEGSEIRFSLLLDPFWHRPQWFGSQMSIVYRPEYGDVKWSVFNSSGSGENGFGVRMRARLREDARVRRERGGQTDFWMFDCDDYDHINLVQPTDQHKRRGLTAPQVLKVVKDLRSVIKSVSLD